MIKKRGAASVDDIDAVDAITLQKLRVFQTVAEFGHFTRAAEHLGITQPVASQHIRKLEERVGAQLFQRVGRNVRLTEAGRRVLKWATDLSVETAAMQRDLQNVVSGGAGETSISSSPSVGSYTLASLVMDFVGDHPDARINLIITDPTSAITAVQTGEISFAVTLVNQEQSMGDLHVEQLWRERYMLVCARDSAWAGRRLNLCDMSELPIITGNPGGTRRCIEDQKLIELGITDRNIILQFGHPVPVKRAALRGLGCAFMFESTITPELESGQLVPVDMPGLEFSHPIFLAYRKRKVLSPMELKLLGRIRLTCSGGC